MAIEFKIETEIPLTGARKSSLGLEMVTELTSTIDKMIVGDSFLISAGIAKPSLAIYTVRKIIKSYKDTREYTTKVVKHGVPSHDDIPFQEILDGVRIWRTK